jgi:hypothetical protein
MRHPSALAFILALLCLVAACDQRPIDMGPEQTGMEWERVVQFGYEPSRYDAAQVWASDPGDVYVWTRDPEPGLQHFNGSVWNAVSYTDNPIHSDGIWGAGPDDVYVIENTVRHFDGVNWQDTGVRGEYISGSSASNIVVATGFSIVQFKGAEWDTLLSSPTYRGIQDVAAYGTDSFFVVKVDSLWQWNGGAWSYYATPTPVGHVTAFSDGSCAVAGYSSGATHVFLFAGGAWTETPLPPTDYIADLWGDRPGSLWVAGRGVWHYDGTSWSSMEIPTHDYMDTVWGTNSGDVYAAGGSGSVIRYDGVQWSLIRSGAPDRGYSLYAASSTDIMVGGGLGTVYRFASGSWLEQPLPEEFDHVLCLSGNQTNIFAGTESGRVYEFDAGVWALSADSLGGNNYARVADICACRDGSVFAVGQGFIARFDGASWTKAFTPNEVVSYVWALNRSVAFATGYGGVFEFDGQTWKRTVLRASRYPEGVWGTSRNDVYIAAGDILHYDGHAWKNVFPKGSYGLIGGSGPDDVVAISEFAVGHFDGAIWREDWLGLRTDQPIDLVTAPSGGIFRMNVHYSNETTFIVSRRVGQ